MTSPVLERRDPVTGAGLGTPMPIERTYTEWSQSVHADPTSGLARTCQECHMPQPDLDGDGTPDAAFACSEAAEPRGPGWPLEGPYRTHAFAGANRWMLEVLRETYGDALGRRASFDAVLAATLELLQERTVELSVSAPAAVEAGSDLIADVRVTNLAGHKFPTGYPEGRRAWVRLCAGPDRDGDGVLDATEASFASATWDPVGGRLLRDPQAKVYELKIGVFDFNGTGACDTTDAAGSGLFHFVRNDCITADNRIPPLGFVPDADTAPVAHTYPENPARPGTLANWDDTSYRVPIPPDAAGPWLVEAAVLHQTTSREHVEFLRDANLSTCDPFDAGCDPTLPDPRPNRGEKLFALWEAHGRSAPTELERVTASLVVTPPPTGACCVGGACWDLPEWSCALNAGSWAGAGVDCALVDCSRPPEPAPGHVHDLRVAKEPSDRVRLRWTPACDALDHALAIAPLEAPLSWTAIDCGLGVAGEAVRDLPGGSLAFVVSGRSSTVDGSLGVGSSGAERPESVGLAPCDYPQDLGATCD